MKRIEDFVMWAVKSNCNCVFKVYEKLKVYGFEEDEINTGISILLEQGKLLRSKGQFIIIGNDLAV